MTRRNAREFVMQMLYEGNFHEEAERERIIYDRINDMEQEEKKANRAVIQFMESLYFGVFEHLQEIDEVIEKYAANWSFSRIAKVDLSILRLAIYELKYTDVPQKVAVNEAVEIAKKYDGPDCGAFINGALGSAIKKMDLNKTE